MEISFDRMGLISRVSRIPPTEAMGVKLIAANSPQLEWGDNEK